MVKMVWITYKATKDTIEVTSTHDIFSVLPENGGELADQRVRLWSTATRGTGYPTYAEIVEKGAKRGRVTKNAILHLEKIINELTKFTATGKKPPRTLFRLFAWNIYSGTWDMNSVPNCNWDDLANLWEYEDPESYYLQVKYNKVWARIYRFYSVVVADRFNPTLLISKFLVKRENKRYNDEHGK
jgi:hypothetical protein